MSLELRETKVYLYCITLDTKSYQPRLGSVMRPVLQQPVSLLKNESYVTKLGACPGYFCFIKYNNNKDAISCK